MDSFTLLWMFDTRWLFGLRPNIHQHLLLLPIILNICLLGVTINDKIKLNCLASAQPLTEVIVMIGILLLLEILVYLILVFRIQAKLKGTPTVNQTRIGHFIRQFEAKKLVWGWAGLVIFLVSFTLQWMYIRYLGLNCIAYGPRVGFYLNLIFWLYLVMIILGFFVSKGIYLLMAWRFPKAFLRMQRVYPIPTN